MVRYPKWMFALVLGRIAAHLNYWMWDDARLVLVLPINRTATPNKNMCLDFKLHLSSLFYQLAFPESPTFVTGFWWIVVSGFPEEETLGHLRSS